MISFEQAFSDTEKAAESARRSAAGLVTRARALERAAKSGNIADIRRAQDRLDEALRALRQEVQNATSSWPFTDEEVEQYLNEQYADELREVAGGIGLNIYERDRNLISYPSIVRMLPRENAVKVDRKKISTIRPSHLAGLLLKNQTRSSGFPSARFLESLYSVYSDIVSGEDSSGRLMKATGRVVPLARIYGLITALPGGAREYDRSDFARDLYTLDANGPRRTKRGATVSFPSSTGARRRKDLFTFIGPEGQSAEYYGIRFSEDV